MASEFQVRGLEGVLQALKNLPPEIVSKNGGPVKTAMRKAANVIRDEARRRVAYDANKPGPHVRDNIVSQRDSHPEKLGVNERYRVGVKGGARSFANTQKNRRAGKVGKKYTTVGTTYWWRFLEFGTEKMQAKPFLVPAFESKKDEALDVIARELDAGITRAAAKVRSGTLP